MKLVVSLFVCGLLAVNTASIEHVTYPFEDEIHKINSIPNGTWTAGHQERFKGLSEDDVRVLCGVKFDKSSTLPKSLITASKDIPTEFDSRKNWPQCKSISEIRDQSNCGSCWALGAVEAMTDRYCIKMNKSVEVSAADLMECCDSCGQGCEGGYGYAAWDYWVDKGITTGGSYDPSSTESSTCKPYPLKSCDHHVKGNETLCPKGMAKTPECVKTCHAGYPTPYKQDLHHGLSAYAVRGVENIQTEIMTKGPVEASFIVYSDFPTYRSGVYKRHSIRPLGGHAVKILGWGDLDSTPYWLVANSWNPDWGQDGYFKILRGWNECGIESGIIAGEPKD